MPRFPELDSMTTVPDLTAPIRIACWNVQRRPIFGAPTRAEAFQLGEARLTFAWPACPDIAWRTMIRDRLLVRDPSYASGCQGPARAR
jgi:hypothetical protein